MRGADDVWVSIGVITYMVPYLFSFASLVKLQNKRRGGRFAHAGWEGCDGGDRGGGIFSTTFAIVLSLIPSPDEANKLLAVSKVVGSAAVLIALGVPIYWWGRSKRGPGGCAVDRREFHSIEPRRSVM